MPVERALCQLPVPVYLPRPEYQGKLRQGRVNNHRSLSLPAGFARSIHGIVPHVAPEVCSQLENRNSTNAISALLPQASRCLSYSVHMLLSSTAYVKGSHMHATCRGGVLATQGVYSCPLLSASSTCRAQRRTRQSLKHTSSQVSNSAE